MQLGKQNPSACAGSIKQALTAKTFWATPKKLPAQQPVARLSTELVGCHAFLNQQDLACPLTRENRRR